MASERLPTHELSAVERVKREHRRDLPMGVSTSLILHSCLVILFAGAATTLYVESKIQQPKEQPSQVITIETLVRTPQTVAQQQPQQMVRQTISRSQPVPVRTTTSQANQPHVALMAAQPTNPQTQTGVSSLGTFATLQGAPGKHHAAKKHKATQDQSKSAAPQAVTANSGTQATSTGTTVYTAPNNGNTAADDEAAAGGYMSPGRGPVWSEHPPTGPGGGGGDSCTPSRGGFLHHRH
jgi:hypothetical protein